ncbi:hypothetical protein N658DRAFT_136581 [Parathielavia hyrcaniae]|uniref:Uncharacterized protein n=1 Tax=Parathielavia hyrcaniae TaxID=113614 RepID=A0AAN6QCS3_9PEZI|nr:hypothetical protein N658DRAFT_136581 [Parathielavia hyrcaniae]
MEHALDNCENGYRGFRLCMSMEHKTALCICSPSRYYTSGATFEYHGPDTFPSPGCVPHVAMLLHSLQFQFSLYSQCLNYGTTDTNCEAPSASGCSAQQPSLRQPKQTLSRVVCMLGSRVSCRRSHTDFPPQPARLIHHPFRTIERQHTQIFGLELALCPKPSWLYR